MNDPIDTMTANRHARYAEVHSLAQLADGIAARDWRSEETRARYAIKLGLRALYLMCRPVKRKRFNKRVRAIRQQLRSLEKQPVRICHG